MFCCTYGTSESTPLKTVWRCGICEAPLREWSKIDIVLSHGYSWLLLAVHRFPVKMVLNSTSDMPSQCVFYLTKNTVPPNFMYKQKLYSDSLCEMLRDVLARCAGGQRPNRLRWASVVLVSVEMCSFCFGLASRYIYWSCLSDEHGIWELMHLFHEILSCVNCTYPFVMCCFCIYYNGRKMKDILYRA